MKSKRQCKPPSKPHSKWQDNPHSIANGIEPAVATSIRQHETKDKELNCLLSRCFELRCICVPCDNRICVNWSKTVSDISDPDQSVILFLGDIFALVIIIVLYLSVLRFLFATKCTFRVFRSITVLNITRHKWKRYSGHNENN